MKGTDDLSLQLSLLHKAANELKFFYSHIGQYILKRKDLALFTALFLQNDRLQVQSPLLVNEFFWRNIHKIP